MIKAGHRFFKEILEGAAAGVLLVSVFCGVVKINAAGADTELPQEYIQYCEQAGQAYSLCPELLEAMIETESGGNPDAVGQAGEIGLMQIYPEYHISRAERLGVTYLFDPQGNILVGADYLAELFLEYGDAGTVLMVYNGVGDAAERGERGDYTEYAEDVLKRTEQLERLHGK